MDSVLKPALKNIPSFIKDTQDFLSIFDTHTHLREDEILVTIDVSALYMSIQHDEGIDAAKQALLSQPSIIMDPDTAATLLAIILKNNTFKFNNKTFLQIQGTAMGTKVAPTYANIFMDQLERKILANSELQPVIWRRFIDGIFAIYRCTEDELIEHLTYHNRQHDTIKFTFEYSRETINFLDTTVYLDQNRKIQTKVYRKPTDMYSYLHLRLRMICSELNMFDEAAHILLKYLTLRGHPHHRAKASINKALILKSADLLKKKQKESKQVIPFILQHNHCHQHAQKILGETKLLFTGKVENRKFYKNKIIIASNRAPNLRDILTSSNFPRTPTRSGSRPCMTLSCNICENIIRTKNITSTHNNNQYRILGDNTCLTKNAVYVIHCPACYFQYVGETGRMVADRINEHKRDIRYCRKESPVAKHFQDHDVLDRDLLCTIVDSSAKDRNIRLRLEEAWIRVLNTMTPSGMNQKLEGHHMITQKRHNGVVSS